MKIDLFFNKKEGSVLTIVILMSVIISLMAASLSQGVRMDFQVFQKDEKRLKAFFLAEAGVSEAYSTLKDNYKSKNDPSQFTEHSLGGGTYDADIIEPDNRIVIRSTGTFRNVSHTIKVEVDFDEILDTFGNGLFANGNLNLSGNSYIDTNIHSNETVNMWESAYVNGTAQAVELVNIGGSAGAAVVKEGAETLTFPTFDFNYYYNLAAPGDRYSSDKTWYNAVLVPTNKVIYVNGNVTLYGDSWLIGTIVATGNITIQGEFIQSGWDEYPALLSRDGNITFNDTSIISNGVIYSGGGNIAVHSLVVVNGHMFSYVNIDVSGYGRVILDENDSIPLGLVYSESFQGIRILTYHE